MTTTKSSVFFFDDIEVREREFCILRAGEMVPVEPRAFRVLLLLLRNPQKLISKEELLSTVWDDVVVTENSLARTILKLRRRLGDDVRSPRYIETVAKVGYRFLRDVEAREERLDTAEIPEGSTLKQRRQVGAIKSPGAGKSFLPPWPRSCYFSLPCSACDRLGAQTLLQA